jgi:branched-subunit amino acid ABC-type transport system permease component
MAMGLVVIYRGSRVINFAYAETSTLAAFVYTDMRLGSNGLVDHGLWPALPVAVLLSAVLGAATEFLVARPLRSAPRMTVLVGTFAVGSLLLTYAINRWKLDPHPTKPLVGGKGWVVEGLTVQPQQVLILMVSVLTLAGLTTIYRYSSFGLRLRAVALDPYAAVLSGINSDLTSLATWALAGALGGLTAILIAPLQTFDVLFMQTIMVRAVAAALIGGLTSVGGAFSAGILIGLAEAVIAFKTPITGITELAVTALILLVAVVLPRGLVRSAY